MVLRLDSQHIASIKAHADRTYPLECCGLLLGKSDPTGKTVKEVRAMKNAWMGEAEDNLTQQRRYAIAPCEMLVVMKEGRDRGLEILGIYHSHPDHPAQPSECDREAAWQQYSYVIVSVPKGQADVLQSWSLNEDHVFLPEDVEIVELTVDSTAPSP